MLSKFFRRIRGYGYRSRSHWGKIMQTKLHKGAGFSRSKARKTVHPFL